MKHFTAWNIKEEPQEEQRRRDRLNTGGGGGQTHGLHVQTYVCSDAASRKPRSRWEGRGAFTSVFQLQLPGHISRLVPKITGELLRSKRSYIHTTAHISSHNCFLQVEQPPLVRAEHLTVALHQQHKQSGEPVRLPASLNIQHSLVASGSSVGADEREGRPPKDNKICHQDRDGGVGQGGGIMKSCFQT